MSSEQAAELIRLGRGIEVGMFVAVLALFMCVALLGFILAKPHEEVDMSKLAEFQKATQQAHAERQLEGFARKAAEADARSTAATERT